MFKTSSVEDPLIPSSEQGWKPLLSEQSVIEILKKTTVLYFQNIHSFTLPLIKPVAFQSLGIVICILGPYQTMIGLSGIQNSINPILILGIACLFLIPGLYLLFKGFWDYFIYMASLNLNVVQSIKGQPLTPEKSFHQITLRSSSYKNLLLLLMLIWLPPLALLFIPPFFMLSSDSLSWVSILSWTGLLLGGASLLIAGVISIYWLLAFQIFAFEPHHTTPLSIIKRSFHLIEGNFLRTLFLLFAISVITNSLIPNIICFLGHVSSLSVLISHGIETLFLKPWLNALQSLIERMNGVFAEIVYQYTQEHVSDIAANVCDMCISSLVTALLLPFGTICFTLLYAYLIAKHDLRQNTVV